MGDEQPEVARGEAFRRSGVLEGLGARLGRVVPEGTGRRLLRGAYRTALRLASGGRGVRATLPRGETVRLLPEYRFVTWNTAEYEAFRAAARPGAIALDVGANAGAYALLLGQWVRPGGRVYAFEPAPETFAGLRRHVRLNGLQDTVVLVRAAAAGVTGHGTLSVDGVSGANRLADGADGATVETITVDDFCERERIAPSFIKIDVEGAELQVLRGARETIRRGGRGLSLFVEMHPTTWREIGVTVRDVQDEIREQRLRVEPLRPVDDPWALEGECLRLVAT